MIQLFQTLLACLQMLELYQARYFTQGDNSLKGVVPIYPPYKKHPRALAQALEEICPMSPMEKALDINPPHVMCGGEKIISTFSYPPEYNVKISAHSCDYEEDKSKYSPGTLAIHLGVSQCGTKLINDIYENHARLYVYNQKRLLKTFNFTIGCPKERVFVLPKVPEILKKPMHQVELQMYFGGQTGLDFVFDFQRSFSGTLYFGKQKTAECMRTIDCGGQVFAEQIPLNCGFERVNDLYIGDVYIGNPEDPTSGHFKASCIAF